MVRSTSRILALFAYIFLSSVLAASADPVIPITNSNDGSTAGTLTVTRTNDVSPGWDEIDLHFASWTVTYPGWGPTFVTSISGTWSGVGGNLGVSSLDGTDWVARTTNANNNTPLESFVNFDSIEPYYYYDGLSVFARGPGSAGSYTSFTSNAAGFPPGHVGLWTTAAGVNCFLGPVDGPLVTDPNNTAAVEESLLAKIYVASGGDVAFDGYFDFWDGTLHSPPSPSETMNVNVAFSTAVPEPSGTALLATWLIGAAILAWRKRS